MKNIIGFALAFGTGILALGSALDSHGYTERRIEYVESSESFCDPTNGGTLCATLTLASNHSALDIYIASNGVYNSRLSSRCSNGRLLESTPRNVTGTSVGDAYHVCGSGIVPIRIEGAIDDL